MTWLNWPNRITIARIILIVPLVICLLNLGNGVSTWRYGALGLFILMAVTDALDGFLARRLQQETAAGSFLDPMADKLLITCTVILLALEETTGEMFRLPSWVPVIAIGKDVLTVLGFALVYANTERLFVQPRAWGKACTLVQLILVGFCLAGPDFARWWPGVPWRQVLLGLCWLASGLAVTTLADYVLAGNRFVARIYEEREKTHNHE